MGNILALIPARGGSKAVPQKNIRPLGGKPLIQYTIETALSVREHFHRLIVSTDSEAIAKVAGDCGAEVPFRRPAELARDTTPTLPVIQHAVRFVESQENDFLAGVLLLQPTTPLRSTEDIKTSLDMFREGGYDSVISVVQVSAGHPIQMKKIENDCLVPYCIEEKEGTRRQDLEPPAYLRNGAIYISRRDVLMDKNSIWGERIRPYIMPSERSVNIDSELDLKLADVLLGELTDG